MRVTDIKFDRNKQGIARSGCVGWTGARAKSLNDNYSCLSNRSQRGWIVQNLRRLFGPSFVCVHKGGLKKPPKLVTPKKCPLFCLYFLRSSTQDLRTIIVTKNQLPNVLKNVREWDFRFQTFARERLAVDFCAKVSSGRSRVRRAIYPLSSFPWINKGKIVKMLLDEANDFSCATANDSTFKLPRPLSNGF